MILLIAVYLESILIKMDNIAKWSRVYIGVLSSEAIIRNAVIIELCEKH